MDLTKLNFKVLKNKECLSAQHNNVFTKSSFKALNKLLDIEK